MMQQQNVRLRPKNRDRDLLAVLVMAYGTPSSLNDIERYLTHIRNGKKPTAEEVDKLAARYAAIGGKSPLIDITKAQAKALQDELERRAWDVRTSIAMLHSEPFIEDAVKEIISEDINRLVSLPLTPYYSTLSIGRYENKVTESLKQLSSTTELTLVRGWNAHPEFIRAWVEKIATKLRALGADPYATPIVVFTAHSLPSKIFEWGDPYPKQILETCNLIAETVGLRHWTLAYQSVGMSGGDWLGPELLDKLSELKEDGHDDFLIVPVGFVSDHLEVLYDIDIECQNFAKENGITVRRVDSLNTATAFIGALASVVEENLGLASGSRSS